MDIELTTIEHSSDDPHYYDEVNRISKISRRPTVPDNENNQSSEISKINFRRWYVFH